MAAQFRKFHLHGGWPAWSLPSQSGGWLCHEFLVVPRCRLPQEVSLPTAAEAAAADLVA